MDAQTVNRAVLNNLNDARNGGAPTLGNPDPKRVPLLFLTNHALGFRTLATQIEAYTERRDDIDAVHVRMRLEGWNRWYATGIPQLRAYDLAGQRHRWGWGRHTDRIMKGLAGTSFACALVTTQAAGYGLARARAAGGMPFGVYLDTTHAQFVDALGGLNVFRRSIDRIEKRVLDAASFVASMSAWAAESAVRDYGVDRSKVIIVRNAVPIAPVPARGSTPGEPVRIAIVGNDWVRKGGPRLLAWHQARWAGRAELHVIGNAPADTSARNVIWHGKVEYARLQTELLPSMDIFALPTTSDMSPWAAIEAAGVGLPVVSSRLGALGEIVIEGTTGYLCTPTDDREYIAAIERLMDDRDLRTRLGHAAREYMLREFTPEANYGRLVDRMIQTATIRS